MADNPEDTGKDFYQILGISRAATDAEIKKAYRKLAMRWHPDKNPDKAEEALSVFQDVGEAYTVLTDKQKKAVFDQYGYEALRDGVPDDAGGYQGGWTYTQNAREIFTEFFGTDNPFADFGFGSDVPFAARMAKAGPTKMKAIARPMDCSLEELYCGCLKTFNVTRKRLVQPVEDEDNPIYEDVTKKLTVAIKPGWRAKTKVTFPGEGDEGPGIIPADICFSVRELPHQHFTRDGLNLLYIHTISLSSALCGHTVNIKHLDGRTLNVSCPEVVQPGYEKVVKGEGMVKGEDRGDLTIRFNIEFPKFLEGPQKEHVQKALGL